MGIIGKLVGGAIGFAMGGPLGAVAGAVFGHAFDASQEHQQLESGGHLSYSEKSQLTFFVAAFSMLAKLAKSDGRISPEEIRSIETFMSQDLNLPPHSRKIAVDIFHAAVDSPESFESFANQFYNEFYAQPQMLEFMVDILLRVSVADGRLSAGEEALIDSAARIFRLSPVRYEQLKSKYVRRSDKYYATLGVSPDDPPEEIKRRYRKLVSEYHPDKIASKGLPEEFTKFANDKFREIQEAYEAVKQDKGFN